MSRVGTMAAALALCFASAASAQFGGLLDRARQKAEEKAAEKAEEAAKGAVSKPPQKAQPAKAGETPAPAQQSAAPRQPAAAQEVYGNRFDFVPGDKVLAFDDFTDCDVGEYPPKWSVKDGGGGNAVEVVESAGKRFLKSRFQREDQGSSLQWLRFTPSGDLPKNFTIEFDADLGGPFAVVFSDPSNFGGQEIRFGWEHRDVSSPNAEGKLPVKEGIQHVSIAVSGAQAKVYVAGERVLADPDAIERPVRRIGFYFLQPWEGQGDHQMFTSFRLGEGGKDAKTMLAGEGRIVTHGILFDTGSDVMRPESGPTLRAVLALLSENGGLRFSIEGHTDDRGGRQVNMPLSQRRADAVKGWLVRQGVDASRLTTRGMGDTKPIDENTTAEGRANNRRVEFVRVEPRADAR